MFKPTILFIIFLRLKKGSCNLGIPVEEHLINTCLSPPALTMAMMMFSDAMKGNSWLTRLSITCRGQEHSFIETLHLISNISEHFFNFWFHFKLALK